MNDGPSDAGNGVSRAEAARLRALVSYDVLDTPAERGFDDVVTLATQLCNTPVALVSFVARDRQWFKARVGFELCETDLDSSVCRNALGMTEILEIADLAADPRTSANPLVTGEPFIRFYAGAPLNTPDGRTLGTLCVIDKAPRPGGLTDAQRVGLRALANQVMAQLDLRRASAEREADRQVALAEAARLEAMIATQQAVASAEADLSVVFQALVDGALRVVDVADGAVVELRNGDDLVYDTVSGTSTRHKGIRLPIKRTLSGKALLAERPMHCADTETDPSMNHALAIGLGIRSLVVVPVTRRGEPVGVLKVQSGRPNAFSPRDVVMTQMLAGLAASAFGDVAEVKSQRALRRAETRYRQTFESVTEFGVVVTDRDGTVAEWNTGAERIFGWTAEEIRGADAERFFTPEDRKVDRLGTEMATSLRDGRAVDERWHLRKDGTPFYASGNMMPLRDDEGAHIGFIKIVRDRTEQHLAGLQLDESRRRLEESEAKWRGLFQNLQEGFILGEVIRDEAGTVTDWRYEEVNRAWGELVGIDPATVVGRTIREVLPDIEDDWVNEFADVVETGQPVRFTRPVGMLERWYDGVCQPAGDDRFIVIFLEVTDRILSQRQLAEAEERRRLATDVGEVGLWELDLATGELSLDARMRAMNGVSGAGLDAAGAFAAVHPEDRARLDRELQRLTSGELGTLSIQYRVVGIEDGVLRTVQVNGLAMRDAGGAATRLIGAARDVTDRVAMDARRAMLSAELAHRLKNNLALVSSIVTQTLRTASDIPSARKTLSDRILALSKAHDVLMTGQRDAASIGDVIRTAVSLHDAGDRVRTEGPDVLLGPKAALTLALIAHELATNAGKYGALSMEGGHVDVDWSVVVDPATRRSDLALEWREVGGPPTSPPTHRNFGTRLIEMGLSGATEATSELIYAPDGLRCRLTASLTELQSAEEAESTG